MEALLQVPTGTPLEGECWPTNVFLHGAGEIGDDLERVNRHGPPKLAAADPTLPFVVVAPQSRRVGWDLRQLDRLMDETMREQPIEADRVYLTGGEHGRVRHLGLGRRPGRSVRRLGADLRRR